MTMTKALTLAAAVLPFGFMLLALALILRKLAALHREDSKRRAG